MSELLQKINELATELETRVSEVRAAALEHEKENSVESFSDLRLSIAYLKPVMKEMRYTIKTSNA